MANMVYFVIHLITLYNAKHIYIYGYVRVDGGGGEPEAVGIYMHMAKV